MIDFFKRRKKEFIKSIIVLIALSVIAYLCVILRSSTLNSPTVLDYDPWWFYRHAKEILDNGFRIPIWDELSYYPPGRPTEPFQGWPITMAVMYLITRIFSTISFVEFAKLSPIIMTLFAIPPAYFLGKTLSNKWGGICTALFSLLTPSFIGVSMGGYCDSDVVVVLYSILTVLSVFLALKKWTWPLKKNTIFYIILPIIVNTVFVYSWGRGWYILLFFAGFMPMIVLFRIIQEIFLQQKFKIDFTPIIAEAKQLFIPLTIILIITNIIGVVFNLSNIYYTITGGYQFVTGRKLIVNISVAELQPINIFTRAGFNQVAGRIGVGPMLFTMFGLPLLVLFKLYKRVKIAYTEIFLFMWALATFYLITRGVRFSLMFSIATAASTGYVVGNMMTLLKRRALLATFFGILAVFSLMFINNAMVAASQASGMKISNNWYDMLDWLKANADKKALIATWWDPGHIITGYTGLRVHADGAHCGIGKCVPYNHDIRIQDMGRLMTTNDENESIAILKKYNGLDSETCAAANEEIKRRYGISIPKDACDPPSEIYVIASADLIGKYYWMSYFGLGQGRNYYQMNFQNFDPNQGIITYAGGLSLVRQDDKWVPVMNLPQQGIRNLIVKEIVYFENGQKHYVFNETNAIDGMVWVDPGYGLAIYMDPIVRDSIFTKMFFFNGVGLKNFELVYSNPEIRLFKAKL